MKSFGTLNILSVLERELPEYGVPASTIAALAGVTGGALSAYLNGTRGITASHDQALRKTWAQLKKFVAFCGDIPVDFRKVTKLRKSLDAMEAGHLQIVVIKSDEAVNQ